ncbi:hypothetical protein NK214_10920 [Chromobacterium sp. S0633]|uniref:hypothetical protein n=1 Tax=Chromobacterium sp. S0633 TaxID=2957805 RepID=UPI00209DB36B|nr:hypothetical protein [Chromobacterium sp. S0633]MCP1290700.1 hypothetical protein [Chromobacterium sp. S0633]
MKNEKMKIFIPIIPNHPFSRIKFAASIALDECDNKQIKCKPTKPIEENKLSKLQNDENESVYIIGHGKAGSPYLSIEGHAFTADALVTQLEQNGLNKEYPGKIKLWTCESGTPGNNGTPAFAVLVLKSLREKGFIKCKVYGYACKLRNKRFSKSEHENPKIKGTINDGNKYGVINADTHDEMLIRAKDARLEFCSAELIQ